MFLFSTPVDRSFRTRLIVGLFLVSASAAVPPIEFLDHPDGGFFASEDGVVSLSWTAVPEPWSVELQQGSSGDFVNPVERYWGTDAGSVLTGLPEGEHYFRVRLVNPDGQAGPWTTPLRAEVTFMDRGRLFWFLGLGGIVVLTTAGAILSGYLGHRKGIEEEVSK